MVAPPSADLQAAGPSQGRRSSMETIVSCRLAIGEGSGRVPHACSLALASPGPSLAAAAATECSEAIEPDRCPAERSCSTAAAACSPPCRSLLAECGDLHADLRQHGAPAGGRLRGCGGGEPAAGQDVSRAGAGLLLRGRRGVEGGAGSSQDPLPGHLFRPNSDSLLCTLALAGATRSGSA